MEVVVSYLRKFRTRYSKETADYSNLFLRGNSNQKTILVAGGAGFLGSRLCEILLGAGHRVICVDDFSTGAMRNVEPMMHLDAFHVVAQDIVEPFDLEVDEIYNLARPASPPHCQADPIRAMQTYVQGSLNLLEVAARCGARILQASTSEASGDPQLHPQTVGHGGDGTFLGRRSSYDEGLRCAEALFADFHELYQVDVKLVRMFNAYGPRMPADEGRIVSNFVLQALRGNDITIYGDASQTRSFCFVDDLIDGFTRIMASPASLPVPIDLANPMEFAIGEVAEQVIELIGSRSKIICRPQAAPRRRRPDISLAMHELGWCPRMDLSGGLLQTIGYFDRLLAGSRRELPEVA